MARPHGCRDDPLEVRLHVPVPRSSGFTLVEVLVVLVIVAVLALALVLSVGASGERTLEDAADRFQALLGHACEEAELGGRAIGTRVGRDGYAFSRLDGNAWHAFAGGDELRPRTWPASTQLELARDGRPLALAGSDPDQAASDAPELACFASGELTPFELTLALPGVPARYRIRGSADGRLARERIDVPQ
jgi:general secretion pathway protein H